jgi:hypothetical protein
VLPDKFLLTNFRLTTNSKKRWYQAHMRC